MLLSCLSFLCRVCYGDDEVSPLGNIGPLQPGEWTRPRRWEGVILIKAHANVYKPYLGQNYLKSQRKKSHDQPDSLRTCPLLVLTRNC